MVNRKRTACGGREVASCASKRCFHEPRFVHQNESYLRELWALFAIHATRVCTSGTATNTSGRGRRRPDTVVDNAATIVAVSNTPRQRRSGDPSEPRLGASPVPAAAAANDAATPPKSRLMRSLPTPPYRIRCGCHCCWTAEVDLAFPPLLPWGAVRRGPLALEVVDDATLDAAPFAPKEPITLRVDAPLLLATVDRCRSAADRLALAADRPSASRRWRASRPVVVLMISLRDRSSRTDDVPRGVRRRRFRLFSCPRVPALLRPHPRAAGSIDGLVVAVVVTVATAPSPSVELSKTSNRARSSWSSSARRRFSMLLHPSAGGEVGSSTVCSSSAMTSSSRSKSRVSSSITSSPRSAKAVRPTVEAAGERATQSNAKRVA